MTAVAPASMYSTTSSTLTMPPQPMMGIFTALAHWWTMRTMIGFTPGPEMPPYLLPIAGRNVSMLILSPRIVLAMTSASAPAASAAFAIATTSPALGDSLHHTGFVVALRMRLITLKV